MQKPYIVVPGAAVFQWLVQDTRVSPNGETICTCIIESEARRIAKLLNKDEER